jgi:short-subunit dehydrogenase
LVFARRLAADYDLLLVARRKDDLDRLAAELATRHGTAVSVLPADLTDETQLKAVAERIESAANLALLVNNAGFGHRGTFWEAELAVLERMHRLHVMAVLALTHAALRAMVPRNRGAIINVASVAAFAQRAGSVSYGATKTWLVSLTEGLYLDLQKTNSAVRVQALCPGFTYSNFHDVLRENRHDLAPPSLWLTADAVVDASLRALARGSLRSVPGWRYKLLVAALGVLPAWLKLRLAGSRRREPA